MSNEIVIVGKLEVPGWLDIMSRVYDIEGIAPCINTMQGGNRQPMILIDENNCSSKGQIQQRRESSTYSGNTAGGYSNTITTVEKDNYVLILPDKASNEARHDPM